MVLDNNKTRNRTKPKDKINLYVVVAINEDETEAIRAVFTNGRMANEFVLLLESGGETVDLEIRKMDPHTLEFLK